jgi:hypothetical protein
VRALADKQLAGAGLDALPVPSATGSVLDWSGTFEAKGVSDSEAVEIITGIYKAGLDALAEKLSE